MSQSHARQLNGAAPPPPPHLNEAERAAYAAIVASAPPGWFARETVGMLESLAITTVRARAIEATLTPKLLAEDPQAYTALARAARADRSLINSISTKLKLTATGKVHSERLARVSAEFQAQGAAYAAAPNVVPISRTNDDDSGMIPELRAAYLRSMLVPTKLKPAEIEALIPEIQAKYRETQDHRAAFDILMAATKAAKKRKA